MAINMRYKYYGTAAYEGIPALWCECDTCKRARNTGGKNVMSRSQQTLDDKILIDFSADTFMHTLQGLPLRKIHTCIITHDHSDHLYPQDMKARLEGYAPVQSVQPLDVYAADAGIRHCERILKEELGDREQNRIKLHKIEPFQSFEAEGYKFTPLKANHGKMTDPVIYIIEKDGKRILHGHDTGYFPAETWEYLENNPVHLDFVSIDCTLVNIYPENNKFDGHMNFSTIKNVRERLRNIGMTDDSTKWAISHFSHNGHMTYDELVKTAAKENFIVAYDGLELEV